MKRKFSKNEIKILICHIFEKRGGMINKNPLILALQSCEIENYFSLNNIFLELMEDGYAKEKDKKIEIMPKGCELAAQLSGGLPHFVKEKVLGKFDFFNKNFKSSGENMVKINKNDRGYDVSCSVSGGDFDLMSLVIFAPDSECAFGIQKKFKNNAQRIYELILSEIM